jgi:hypothetical protein
VNEPEHSGFTRKGSGFASQGGGFARQEGGFAHQLTVREEIPGMGKESKTRNPNNRNQCHPNKIVSSDTISNQTWFGIPYFALYGNDA